MLHNVLTYFLHSKVLADLSSPQQTFFGGKCGILDKGNKKNPLNVDTKSSEISHINKVQQSYI